MHPGKTFTASGTVNYSAGPFFEPEAFLVDGPRDMHRVLLQMARERSAFVVRAQRAHDMPCLRRTKNAYGDCPAGLRGTPLHWAAFDCDKWQNVWGLDPRTQSGALIARIRQTLGVEFTECRGTLQWSSSCCVGVPVGTAPEFLSFRIWAWAAREMGEEALVALCKRLDTRVRSALGCQEHAGWLVDPKVPEIQQPVFIANPVFRDGLKDPMGYHRWVWLEGKHDFLDVIQLGEGLPPVPGGQPWRMAKVPTEPRERPTPRPRSTTVSVPGQPVPLAAAARELAAFREALVARGWDAFRDRCVGFGRARATLELVALAVHRGGLQPGERDEMATMIASGVVATLPVKPALSPGRVRQEVRSVLRLCVGGDWVSSEWENKGDVTIISRYVDACRLVEAGKLNRVSEPRYTYTLERLSREWSASDEECRILGLRSLAPQRLLSQMARQEAGSDKRAAKLAQRAENLRRVHVSAAEGFSLRQTSEALSIPYETCRRLLAEPAPAPVSEAVAEDMDTQLAA